MGGQAYDHAKRRRSKRTGRERGCWLYIPAEELDRALGRNGDAPPYYRVWGLQGASVIVKLYREP